MLYFRADIFEKTTNWKITKTIIHYVNMNGTPGLKVTAVFEHKHSRIYQNRNILSNDTSHSTQIKDFPVIRALLKITSSGTL